MYSPLRRTILRRIADTLPNGTNALATYLQVSQGDVRLWIDGVTPIPDVVFLKAVDLHTMLAASRTRSLDKLKG